MISESTEKLCRQAVKLVPRRAVTRLNLFALFTGSAFSFASGIFLLNPGLQNIADVAGKDFAQIMVGVKFVFVINTDQRHN